MVNVLPLFGPVGPEMIVILLVLVLLFGANKIPKLARSTGQAMGEFKKGRQDIEDELQDMTNPDAETTASSATETESAATETDDSDEELETESTEKTN
jgi:sec-independent protein translocase protein TatA